MSDLNKPECPTCYLNFKEIEALREVANAAREAILNTPHTTECIDYKNVGIHCNCWQREVAEAIDKLYKVRHG